MTNFNLIQHHKYSLSELDNMIPFEREIYVIMLIEHIKEENDRLKQQQRQHMARKTLGKMEFESLINDLSTDLTT